MITWLSGLGILFLIGATFAAGKEQTLVTAKNPRLAERPTLSVWQQRLGDRVLTYVKSTFPNVPRFTCDTWCYESDVEFLDAKALEGGRVQLRHWWKPKPEVVCLTTVTPEAGAVEFLAKTEKPAAQRPFLNACWQLRNAPDFASKPDPYPEFVKRCFIFTEAGFTFLDKTTRLKHVRWPENDKYNNPPWVQMYTPVWRPVVKTPPKSWAAYSPDRYIYPIIGAVSRDGKYLTALANANAASMGQAWHDCMHNNPSWASETPGGEPVWRLKIYAMDNDPKALLRRVGKDFPTALTLKEGRVPPEMEEK